MLSGLKDTKCCYKTISLVGIIYEPITVLVGDREGQKDQLPNVHPNTVYFSSHHPTLPGSRYTPSTMRSWGLEKSRALFKRGEGLRAETVLEPGCYKGLSPS